jgi:tRNA dimethylallyltransferase
VALAQKFDGEIINADSQQVYRGLDIGTGKPTVEERKGVRHHLFDIAHPWEQLDAMRFAELADETLPQVAARGRIAIVVGGTGLWIRALLKGLVDAPGRDEQLRARLHAEAERHGLAFLHARLREVDPDSAERIRSTDPVRIIRALEVFELGGVPLSRLYEEHRAQPPRHRALQLGIDLPRAELDERINRRVQAMFDGGLLVETSEVLQNKRARPRVQSTMGYREALQYLEGGLSLQEAVTLTANAQRQYARRQRTWFKAEKEWNWLEAGRFFEQAAVACEGWLRELSSPGRPHVD